MDSDISGIDDLEHRHRGLARQLADIGLIASGSLAQRFNRCGKPACACHDDPPRLHGPYWHWTAKIGGRTINRRLTPTEADRYNQWITNDRHARALLAEMRTITTQIAALLLNTPTDQV